jgi:Phage major capsid protein E
MTVLNIFNNDAFSLASLTDVVNNLKYRPSRLKELGLFKETPISTLTVAIESIGDTLQLIEPTARGLEGETSKSTKRSVRSLEIPHFKRQWAVMASEVQGLRQIGSENELMPYMQFVAQRMGNNLQDFDLTEEHARLGAITGKITYAGKNPVVLDLFQEFNVTPEVETDLKLTTAADGDLRKSTTTIIRTTKAKLGSPFEYVHCMCGDNGFDKLLQNKEVRATYLGWSEAQILRDSYIGLNRGSNPIFKFGGIVFENYGEIDGEGIGIAKEKFQFFPMGVDNLFRTYYAPADYEETLNTLGKRIYSKQKVMDYDRGRQGEMQMNALQLCTKPQALLSAKA